jgi:hypothetical protein
VVKRPRLRLVSTNRFIVKLKTPSPFKMIGIRLITREKSPSKGLMIVWIPSSPRGRSMMMATPTKAVECSKPRRSERFVRSINSPGWKYTKSEVSLPECVL